MSNVYDPMDPRTPGRGKSGKAQKSKAEKQRASRPAREASSSFKVPRVSIKPAKTVKPPRSNISAVETKAKGRIGNLGDFAHPPKGRKRT
jgi:hypothetical protein